MGCAVGDALGVPVEFESREYLESNPIQDFIGYGSHEQPPGTWSDDTSLTLCLASALLSGYDLDSIAFNFRQWYENAYWTSHGEVFDIGNATRRAITRLKQGISPIEAGGTDKYSNGNGSLMRILPLLVVIEGLPIFERYKLTSEVSSITHAHFISRFSCFLYLEMALLILKGQTKEEAYQELKRNLADFRSKHKLNPEELSPFNRILNADITQLPEEDIQSSGYVIHTLEASLWCFLSFDGFSSSVLKAVNLGEDTDTTGAVTGAISGLYYGMDSIPESWVSGLARSNGLMVLAGKLSDLKP